VENSNSFNLITQGKQQNKTALELIHQGTSLVKIIP